MCFSVSNSVILLVMQQLLSQQKDSDQEESKKLNSEREANLKRIQQLTEETGKLKNEVARSVCAVWLNHNFFNWEGFFLFVLTEQSSFSTYQTGVKLQSLQLRARCRTCRIALGRSPLKEIIWRRSWRQRHWTSRRNSKPSHRSRR